MSRRPRSHQKNHPRSEARTAQAHSGPILNAGTSPIELSDRTISPHEARPVEGDKTGPEARPSGEARDAAQPSGPDDAARAIDDLEADFFARGDQWEHSLDAEHAEPHAEPTLGLPPRMLDARAIARRGFIRRMVVAALGAAGVLSICGARAALERGARAETASLNPTPPANAAGSADGRTPTPGSSPSAAPEAPATASNLAPPAEPQAAVESSAAVGTASNATPAVQAPGSSAPTSESMALPSASAATGTRASEKSPGKAVVDAAGAKERARALVDQGKMRDAIDAAHHAIQADPTDAESYLLLGTALQETGQGGMAMDAFSTCVRTATRGPKGECRALGGR